MKTISDFQFGLTKSETNLTAVYFDFARISAIFSIIQWPWRLWHYSVFIDPTDLLFIPSWSFRSVSIRLFKHINQFPLMPVSPLENEPSVYCVPKLVGRQACGEHRGC